MNIFKILANGDGSINEANVSAFLGYLLNPYADHGLGFEFLENFLKQIEIQEENFNALKYDYEIFFEQAFKEEDKSKQIVDIVILCINNDIGTQKESYVKNILSNERRVEYIFLIENKIKKSAKKTNQLEDQLTSTITELSKIPELKIDNDKIYSIYITPKDDSLIKEFKKLESSTKKHIFWKETNISVEQKSNAIVNSTKMGIKTDAPAITNTPIVNNENKLKQEMDCFLIKILKDIIEKEAKTEIDAINEYTKHTIKSFIQFIQNDFKSERQEQKDRKNDGSYTKEYIDINNKTDIKNKLQLIKSELIKRNADLVKYLSEPDLKAPMVPKLSLDISDIFIEIQSYTKKRDSVSLLFRINSKNKESREKLELIAKKLKVDIKNKKSTQAYCKTEMMKKDIRIDDFDTIYNRLEETIKLIKI